MNELVDSVNEFLKQKKLKFWVILLSTTCPILMAYFVDKIIGNFFYSAILSVVGWWILNFLTLFVLQYYYNRNPQNYKEVTKALQSKTGTRKDNFQLITTLSNTIFRQYPLPLSLKQLRVKNYYDIRNIEVKDIPTDTNWIFFIGENGFGKTLMLRAIAIGFVGDEDGKDSLIESYDTKIGIEYIVNGVSKYKNLWDKSSENIENIVCYGPIRLEVQSDQSLNEIGKKNTVTYSLFNLDGVLLNIEYSMLIWSLKRNEKFESVKSIFKKLIPSLEDIQITDDEKVVYFEKEAIEGGEIYSPVQFIELATGFRSIIAMVGDMIIRFSKSQPHIDDFSELAGIVIIDELDLHWHPKMQREIPQLLSKIFPKVQFIASTHSLVPLLGAPENSVLLKVNRTKEEGITVEKVEVDFQALSSDTMLRDIFDLEKYMSDAKQKAWDRYVELKRLIYFEKDESQKQTYITERERLGDKYNFGV